MDLVEACPRSRARPQKIHLLLMRGRCPIAQRSGSALHCVQDFSCTYSAIAEILERTSIPDNKLCRMPSSSSSSKVMKSLPSPSLQIRLYPSATTPTRFGACAKLSRSHSKMPAFDRQLQVTCILLTLPVVYYAATLSSYRVCTVALSLHAVLLLSYARILFPVIYTTFFSPLRSLPSAPDDTYLYGHTLQILQRPSVETLLRWMRTTPSRGMLRASGLLHTRYSIVLTSPDAAYELLTRRSAHFAKPASVRDWLETLMGGGGIITAEGAAHTLQRKSLTRVFTNTATRDLVPLFWQKACTMTNIISTRLGQDKSGVIDLAPLSAGITLDIISTAVFGHDLDCATNDNEPLHQAWSYLANPDTTRGGLETYYVASALLPLWLTRNFPSNFVRTFNQHRRNLRQLCTEIVACRRTDPDREKRKDILSLMMRDVSAEKDTDVAVVDQMLTLLAAGHDTTSGSLLWAVLLLAGHSEVQERMYSEIQTVLAMLKDDGAQFDAQSLDHLTYSTAVANEVMRLFPTVAMTAREALCQTEVAGQLIPKGTRVYIASWALQRLESVWGEDAGDFKPERWLDSHGELDHTGGAREAHAFQTFLSGPRSCIGQHFARNELRCLMAAIVSRFVVSPDAQHAGRLRMSGILTVQPSGGLRVRLAEREVKN